jgi:hypothetical protein
MAAGQASVDPRFDLQFEQRPGYVYLRVTGVAVGLEIAIAYWLAIARICRDRRTQPVLLVEDISGESPDREDRVPELASALAGLDLTRFRIAVVKHMLADISLAEAVALAMQASGWDVRVFANEGEAMLWLLHGAG